MSQHDGSMSGEKGIFKAQLKSRVSRFTDPLQSSDSMRNQQIGFDKHSHLMNENTTQQDIQTYDPNSNDLIFYKTTTDEKLLHRNVTPRCYDNKEETSKEDHTNLLSNKINVVQVSGDSISVVYYCEENDKEFLLEIRSEESNIPPKTIPCISNKLLIIPIYHSQMITCFLRNVEGDLEATLSVSIPPPYDNRELDIQVLPKGTGNFGRVQFRIPVNFRVNFNQIGGSANPLRSFSNPGIQQLPIANGKQYYLEAVWEVTRCPIFLKKYDPVRIPITYNIENIRLDKDIPEKIVWDCFGCNKFILNGRFVIGRSCFIPKNEMEYEGNSPTWKVALESCPTGSSIRKMMSIKVSENLSVSEAHRYFDVHNKIIFGGNISSANPILSVAVPVPVQGLHCRINDKIESLTCNKTYTISKKIPLFCWKGSCSQPAVGVRCHFASSVRVITQSSSTIALVVLSTTESLRCFIREKDVHSAEDLSVKMERENTEGSGIKFTASNLRANRIYEFEFRLVDDDNQCFLWDLSQTVATLPTTPTNQIIKNELIRDQNDDIQLHNSSNEYNVLVSGTTPVIINSNSEQRLNHCITTDNKLIVKHQSKQTGLSSRALRLSVPEKCFLSCVSYDKMAKMVTWDSNASMFDVVVTMIDQISDLLKVETTSARYAIPPSVLNFNSSFTVNITSKECYGVALRIFIPIFHSDQRNPFRNPLWSYNDSIGKVSFILQNGYVIPQNDSILSPIRQSANIDQQPPCLNHQESSITQRTSFIVYKVITDVETNKCFYNEGNRYSVLKKVTYDGGSGTVYLDWNDCIPCCSVMVTDAVTQYRYSKVGSFFTLPATTTNLLNVTITGETVCGKVIFSILQTPQKPVVDSFLITGTSSYKIKISVPSNGGSQVENESPQEFELDASNPKPENTNDKKISPRRGVHRKRSKGFPVTVVVVDSRTGVKFDPGVWNHQAYNPGKDAYLELFTEVSIPDGSQVPVNLISKKATSEVADRVSLRKPSCIRNLRLASVDHHKFIIDWDEIIWIEECAVCVYINDEFHSVLSPNQKRLSVVDLMQGSLYRLAFYCKDVCTQVLVKNAISIMNVITLPNHGVMNDSDRGGQLNSSVVRLLQPPPDFDYENFHIRDNEILYKNNILKTVKNDKLLTTIEISPGVWRSILPCVGTKEVSLANFVIDFPTQILQSELWTHTMCLKIGSSVMIPVRKIDSNMKPILVPCFYDDFGRYSLEECVVEICSTLKSNSRIGLDRDQVFVRNSNFNLLLFQRVFGITNDIISDSSIKLSWQCSFKTKTTSFIITIASATTLENMSEHSSDENSFVLTSLQSASEYHVLVRHVNTPIELAAEICVSTPPKSFQDVVDNIGGYSPHVPLTSRNESNCRRPLVEHFCLNEKTIQIPTITTSNCDQMIVSLPKNLIFSNSQCMLAVRIGEIIFHSRPLNMPILGNENSLTKLIQSCGSNMWVIETGKIKTNIAELFELYEPIHHTTSHLSIIPFKCSVASNNNNKLFQNIHGFASSCSVVHLRWKFINDSDGQSFIVKGVPGNIEQHTSGSMTIVEGLQAAVLYKFVVEKTCDGRLFREQNSYPNLKIKILTKPMGVDDRPLVVFKNEEGKYVLKINLSKATRRVSNWTSSSCVITHQEITLSSHRKEKVFSNKSETEPRRLHIILKPARIYTLNRYQKCSCFKAINSPQYSDTVRQVIETFPNPPSKLLILKSSNVSSSRMLTLGWSVSDCNPEKLFFEIQKMKFPFKTRDICSLLPIDHSDKWIGSSSCCDSQFSSVKTKGINEIVFKLKENLYLFRVRCRRHNLWSEWSPTLLCNSCPAPHPPVVKLTAVGIGESAVVIKWFPGQHSSHVGPQPPPVRYSVWYRLTSTASSWREIIVKKPKASLWELEAGTVYKIRVTPLNEGHNVKSQSRIITVKTVVKNSR